VTHPFSHPMRATRTILLALLLAGLGPACTPASASARVRAQDAAAAEGYAPGVFVVRSVEQVGPDGGAFAGMWRVELEHVAPAPPGGHCTMYVDLAGRTTRVFHGE
jgi:hypothetical protein